MSKRILLLSPYDVASHRYWWEGLKQNFPEYDWTVLTLPARYFAWRMRGNSLSWAYEKKEVLTQDYDLLIACSMTDLSSLRGFIPSLSQIPTIVYCHENQFYYPENDQQQGKLEQQIIQIYNFECANTVIFNSLFNRNTCIDGIGSLLKKLPDHVPQSLIDSLKNKSEVLPVPLSTINIEPQKNKAFTITWNHRWEYDKGLKQLSLLLEKIVSSDMDCKVNILGQKFRQVPEDMKKALSLIKETKFCGHIGFIENKEEYLKTLSASHIVLSTSLHEFQGLSIMEAVKLKCIPVLPNRLSYQEFFSKELLYTSCESNPEQESKHAFEMIKHHYKDWENKEQLVDYNSGDLVKSDLANSIPSWENTKSAYKDLISGLFKA